jgi:hypothetical protein
MADAKKPAEKKTAAEINKSEEIRKVAAAMKVKGEKPRPVTIIAALKAKGIEVSSPQVSMVLKRLGFRPRKRRKSDDGVAATGANKPGKAKAKISVEDLIAAKKAVGRLGGLDRAIAAIEALRQFET